ncbi:hypothetical protein B0T24DRAFT_222264 [Lasiosphaeria ovina]|uniref:Uncharacterized protein n=1 Tax=Lasiosphaeria ovina TaxID=92902 RepID=A0AAE0NAX2_9PEZI|nr:hypothetical protein B0T24DRAFT_222264 [Lasiosphaeria ovina]
MDTVPTCVGFLCLSVRLFSWKKTSAKEHTEWVGLTEICCIRKQEFKKTKHGLLRVTMIPLFLTLMSIYLDCYLPLLGY